MTEPKARCIVCDHEGIVPPVFLSFGKGKISCVVCGDYQLGEELYEDKLDTEAAPISKRYLLQAWIKRHALTGAEPPVLTDNTCAAVIRDSPDLTPTQKMDQLLLAIAALCKRAGHACRLNLKDDYPYAYASDPPEADRLRYWLSREDLVEGGQDAFLPTRKGWDRVQELLAVAPGRGNTVFVAMWFDEALDSSWSEGLKPGIEKGKKYQAHRVKEEIHNDKIDDRIIAGIRACRFLVADVTGARPAVYYEAGFAHGLGKQVIWTCRDDEVERICFDTRQFSHIVWDKPEALSEKLHQKITALNL